LRANRATHLQTEPPITTYLYYIPGLRANRATHHGAEIASGVYFYRLKADATQTGLGKNGKYDKTHKMVMLK
jgi:hypothetical protein